MLGTSTTLRGLTQALGRASETSVTRAPQRGILAMFRASYARAPPATAHLRIVQGWARQISSGAAGVGSRSVPWLLAVRPQAHAATSPAAHACGRV